MCHETSTDLKKLFEPVQVPTTEQDLPFDYLDATILNDKQVYKKGNVLQFIFPKNGLLIPESVVLFFNLLFEGSSAQARALIPAYDISTLFSRVTVTYGRTVILEDIQEYGQLSQLFSIATKSGLRAVTQAGVFQGETLLTSSYNAQTRALTFTGGSFSDNAHSRPFYHNPAADVSVAPGQAPRRYMVKLNLGFLQQNKPIPLLYMNEELRLNFYLQDQVQKFAYCVSTTADQSGPVINDFQLGRPALRYKVYYPSLQLKNQIFNYMSRNMFTLQWVSFQHQKFPLSSTQTNQTVIIKAFRKRIKYALAVIRSELDLDDPQADATATYVALDPRVPSATGGTSSSGGTVDQARKTTLKEYQWIYNNRSIPKNPVQVLGVHPIYTFNTTTAPTTVLYSVDAYNGASAAEAYYYFRETLGLESKEEVGPIVKDFPWVTQDSWHGATTGNNRGPINTQLSLSTATTTHRAPCSFVIAGKFFDTLTLPDGTKQETAVDCTSLNSNLQLKLQFNNPSGAGSPYAQPYPRMYLDVWVAYHVTCQINDLGEITMEQ
jgi:hypothetical protein